MGPRFYREPFGWEINKMAGSAASGMEYWLVTTVPTDAQGQPTGPFLAWVRHHDRYEPPAGRT